MTGQPKYTNAWATNCLTMGSSDQWRPEVNHTDGYEGRIPTTWAGIEKVRQDFGLALVRNQLRSGR